MSRRPFTFALEGGLDQVTQPLALKPGRAIQVLNYESLDQGYGRIEGFERFDGRTGPTDFPFYLLEFDAGDVAIVAGNTVTGGTSGATGVVLVDASVESGSWAANDAAGMIGLRSVTGTFQDNETLTVGGSPVATAVGTQLVGEAPSSDTYEAAVGLAARTYARGLIGTVTGSGDIRGVWEFDVNGKVYAFRDNVGGTEGKLWVSSTSGWTAVALGRKLAFTSGGATEIVVGNTITGAISGATAVITRIVLQSGTWAGGDAAGYFIFASQTGTFQAENLNVGAALNLATIAGNSSAITLPAGGRYSFITHNFYGASSTRRIYGVNGVGEAFEFDGTVFCPIDSGATTDTPNRIAVYRNHLILGFPNGYVQTSEADEPVGFDTAGGAFGFGVGSDVSDFIVSTSALLILAEFGIFALTGANSDDFVLAPITLEAGALPYTGQRIGPGIYLDNRGIRSISTAQEYGNFRVGTMSDGASNILRSKARAGVRPCASIIARTKNHYRVFFDDGTGLSLYIGRKYPEPMYFDIGKEVTCICSNESADDVERIFFGSTDGYIYQLDKGTSLDGSDLGAFVQLAYAHMGTPNILKRVHKVQIECVSDGYAPMGIAIEYDYSSNEQIATSQRNVEAQGVGGLYGVANYSEIFWSAPVENVLEADVEGQGFNASALIYSEAEDVPAYILRGATLHYSDRGARR